MARYRAKFSNSARVSRTLFRVGEILQEGQESAVEDVAQTAARLYRQEASKISKRVASGITVRKEGKTLVVRASAKDPRSGYDYVGVTRFGHRKERIYPAKRRPASVVSTGKKRGKGGRAALRFEINGKVLYRSWVRGFKPAGDWADRVHPLVEQEANRQLASIGRRLAVRRDY